MKNKTLFLDCETTGLDPLAAQIVEIAIVDEVGRCVLATRYNIDESLRLQSDKEIDSALEYNKLSREELSLYHPIDKFDLSTIEAILNSADLVVGHNINFDASFLSETSKRILGHDCFANVEYTCTMTMLAKSKGIKSGRVKLPNMQLDNIAHSALSDAQNCRLLYQSLKPSENSSPEWNW
jgi:DNA polymerase III epsilon subunit-like protein